MFDRFNYSLIPPFTREALRAWVVEGRYPGGFLIAVLKGDLHSACGRADGENAPFIVQLSMFLYNRTPMNCFGSPEKVKEWPEKLKEHRKNGASVTFGPFDPNAVPHQIKL